MWRDFLSISFRTWRDNLTTHPLLHQLVPKSIAKRNVPVFFAVRALGGNMQGWRKDPKNNPPRIRIDFYELRGGEFVDITNRP